ncbi:MAG: hypothetical protein FWB88_05305 [Defluviitaleaceae bacterium]|nr:hypothetical protein [Defluviitaleaceae bacterium]MCL2239793.1 hypothetical protein [Defluviitaleaceae bacterium]
MSNEYYPMNAAELLDRVFDVYKKSFWKQLAYAAIVGAAGFVAMGFFTMLLGVGIVVSVLMFAPTAVFAGLLAFLFLFIPFILFWQAAISTGSILLSRQAFLGQRVKLPMFQLMRRIGRVTLALLAQVIVAVPYLAIVGGILFLFFWFVDVPYALWMTRVYVTFSIVILLAAIAGFFMYMHIFSLAVAVAVNERVMFFRALHRSFVLVKEDFWRLLGVRVMWWLIVLVLSMATQGVLSLVPMLVGVLAAGSYTFVPMMLGLQLILGIFSVGLSFAMYPLDGIMVSLMYFNQRIKHEGFDIEIAVERMNIPAVGATHAL